MHWTYEDGAGNTSGQNQTIVVIDQTDPVPMIANLPNLIDSCTITLTSPTANDNCDGSITATTTSPLVLGQGVYVITWEYEDASGNIFNQNQNVTVLGCAGLSNEISVDVSIYPNPTDEVVFGDTDTFIIGGHAGDVAYNVISDSGGAPAGSLIDSDDDLFIEGSLEVDGTLYFDGSIDTTFTQGSIVFAGANGVLTQDNAQFFFDDTGDRLGIGTASPVGKLTLTGTVTGKATVGEGSAAIQVDLGGIRLDEATGGFVGVLNTERNVSTSFGLQRVREFYDLRLSVR